MNRPIKLRHASLEDAAEISDIHRSHVDRWYRKLDNEQYEVPYGSLSLSERWGFGGPWMSIETCSVHLNNLILQRQLPFVAEEDGKLVGEMELFMGEEGGLYGKNMHIGLLFVRRGHTGQGIGSALVDKAFKLAESQGCDTVTVASSQANVGFYEKHGFRQSGTMVELEAVTKDHYADISILPPPLSPWSFTRGMAMPLGRYQSSAFHVFEMGDDYALPAEADCRHIKTFMSVNGNPSLLSYVCLPTGTVEVSAWSAGATAGDMAFAALTDLNRRGITAARMLLSKSDYDRIDDLVDERILGSRRTLLMKL
jgi:GNAT superfamily N-acetyltransferase